MFDNLSDKLENTFRDLTGKGALSEKNIEDAMREIRMALLDADVMRPSTLKPSRPPS